MAYCYQIVGIGAVEVGYAYARRQRFLTLECLIKTLPKMRLYTQSLQHKYTHPYETLFGRVAPLVDGIVENQNDKVMSPICIDNERPESLVTL